MFSSSCHKIKRNFELKLTRTCLKLLIKTQISPKGHNQRWVMALWLWPWNNRPVFPTEVAWVSTTSEGGAAKAEQCWQPLPPHPLFFKSSRRYCPTLVHSSSPDNNLGLLHRSPSPAEGCSKKKMATVLGKWWLAASSWQCTCQFYSSCAGFFFGKTSHHPGVSAPLQPRFGSLQLLAFPKTKLTLKGRRLVNATII